MKRLDTIIPGILQDAWRAKGTLMRAGNPHQGYEAGHRGEPINRPAHDPAETEAMRLEKAPAPEGGSRAGHAHAMLGEALRAAQKDGG